jgi:hypothetical protein
MAWYGDTCLKQGAVIQFLVADKELVTNIHRRLKMYMETVLLIKALLVGIHKLRVLRKAKWSSVTFLALAGQQQQSLRRCCNVLTNRSERTDGLQPESLQQSSQYPRDV